MVSSPAGPAAAIAVPVGFSKGASFFGNHFRSAKMADLRPWAYVLQQRARNAFANRLIHHKSEKKHGMGSLVFV